MRRGGYTCRSDLKGIILGRMGCRGIRSLLVSREGWGWEGGLRERCDFTVEYFLLFARFLERLVLVDGAVHLQVLIFFSLLCSYVNFCSSG